VLEFVCEQSMTQEAYSQIRDRSTCILLNYYIFPLIILNSTLTYNSLSNVFIALSICLILSFCVVRQVGEDTCCPLRYYHMCRPYKRSNSYNKPLYNHNSAVTKTLDFEDSC